MPMQLEMLVEIFCKVATLTKQSVGWQSSNESRGKKWKRTKICQNNFKKWKRRRNCQNNFKKWKKDENLPKQILKKIKKAEKLPKTISKKEKGRKIAKTISVFAIMWLFWGSHGVTWWCGSHFFIDQRCWSNFVLWCLNQRLSVFYGDPRLWALQKLRP